MRRLIRPVVAGVVLAGALLATSGWASSVSAAERPETYALPGDADGSRFEGIGYHPGTGTYVVSETTGGEIHRGAVTAPEAQEWLPGDGTHGRWTARGVTVDSHGRVYVAGGPNRIQHPGAPDLWVYSPAGELLAALDVGVDNAFLNDVAIGPDGAAYFTNSNAPQVFRVARTATGWTAETWLDATGVIETAPGFNLGGIVVTADRQALVVAQGNVGRLWRVDLATRAVRLIDTGGTDLVNADGLVLLGEQLWVVRNFSRVLTELALDPGAGTARLVSERATPADRVLTTAKFANGRLLVVDSKFDEPVAQPPYQVLSLGLHR